MAAPFRLGPALVQSSDSAPQIPDPFRTALLRALDSRSRLAVALTCKPALRRLLSDRDSVTLHLSVRPPPNAEQPDSTVLRRMHSASSWLPARQGQPLTLALTQQGQGPRSEAYWFSVLSVLGAGQTRPGLTLSLQLPRITPPLLAFAGSAFPELTSLSLGPAEGDGSTFELPPPETLPALRRLTIAIAEESQAALWASVQPYIQQLTSLTITERCNLSTLSARPRWAGVFSPAGPSSTLTHLSLPCILRPWLVQMLQQSLPVLAELTVSGVAKWTQDREQLAPVCSWRTLRVSNEFLCLHESSWLPQPTGGKLVIEHAGVTSAAMELAVQGMDSAVLVGGQTASHASDHQHFGQI